MPNINREILKLAIPAIMVNISVPLVGAFDTALMGRISVSHLSALGVGSMIFMFIYGNFSFLRMGVTGMSAQAFGAGNGREISLIVQRGFALAAAVGILIVALQNPLYSLSRYFMGISAGYDDLARSYFSIRVLAAPAVMGQYVLAGYFFGIQNAFFALLLTVIVTVCNIIFTLLLVLPLDMGISGAAWGSVAAQYIGLGFGLWIFRMSRRASFEFKISELLDAASVRKFFRINRNIFFRTLALTFSLLFFYAQAAREGEGILAVMVILMQFLVWMSFAVDGFANAAESLVGKYFGAGDRVMFERAVGGSFFWGGAMAVFFSFLYFNFGDIFISVFTSDGDIAALASSLLPYVAPFPILAFWAFIFDGIFIGMTAVTAMRNTVVLSTLLYVGSNYLLKAAAGGAEAVWLSFVLFFVFRGILQSYVYLRHGWNLR